MKCVLVHNRMNLILYLKNADKLELKESIFFRDLDCSYLLEEAVPVSDSSMLENMKIHIRPY